jgi:hypothetical protein
MARAIALVVGMLILAAVAHVTIQSTAGYGSAHSWVTMGNDGRCRRSGRRLCLQRHGLV